MSDPVRINKFIALQGGLSRREADNLVEHGHVLVNGTVADLGMQVSASDRITIKGKPLDAGTKYQYLALHKPIGYVCSKKQQGESPTIYSLLPNEYHHLKPVGRLDRDSSGIILLTNDGDFAHRMTHPKFKKTKVYQVALNKSLAPLHQQMISDYGVSLEDGSSTFLVEPIASGDKANHDSLATFDKNNVQVTNKAKNDESPAKSKHAYQVTMSEGRNRQIRRTFAALGYTVTKLHRTTFGNFEINDMKPGTFTFIDV